jgi:BirA family transcriptional regulator, biotin operon repressor / biotin---[acetyl-CoA-carboxylase] ligase
MSEFAEWNLPTQFIGRRVLVYDRTDSTNERAAELAGSPAADGLVILARQQTAGRGQHGRSWQCPPGSGVLLSILIHPSPELRRAAILTGWAAVSVCETIRYATQLQSQIKWPNDVLLDGRKVCGILSELRITDCRLRMEDNPPRWAAIVGIGLNVNQPAEAFQSPGLELGTSLAVATGKSLDCDEIAQSLIQHLDEEYGRMQNGDLTSLESRWKQQIGLLGRQVQVECNDADHHGQLRDMCFDALELELRNGQVLRMRPELVQHISLANRLR